MSNNSDAIREAFVKAKVNECLQRFLGVARVDDFVRQSLINGFKGNFDKMLKEQYEQVWSEKGNWVLDQTEAMAYFAMAFARNAGRDRPNQRDVEAAIGEIRELACQPQDLVLLGGWCTP